MRIFHGKFASSIVSGQVGELDNFLPSQLRSVGFPIVSEVIGRLGNGSYLITQNPLSIKTQWFTTE